MVPTIGRRMYFFAAPGVRELHDGIVLDAAQPFDAGVVFVHNETTINILSTDHTGAVAAVKNVHVRQEADKILDDGTLMDAFGEVYDYWVEWMPYQKAKAAEEESKPYAAVPHVPQ